MSLRISTSFSCQTPDIFKQKLLQWIKDFKVFSFLDANQFQSSPVFPDTAYEWIAGIDAVTIISPVKNYYQDLQHEIDQDPDWYFGYLSYDLKNETEKLSSSQEDHLEFPALFFFQPRIVIYARAGEITISIYVEKDPAYKTPEDLFHHINTTTLNTLHGTKEITFKGRVKKEYYIDRINRLQQHIRRGDIYEINFCMEYYAEQVSADPLSLFDQLQKKAPSPFSCFFRLYDRYIICASPERYLRKKGTAILSQPMKGTAARGLTVFQDKALMANLLSSEKELSENIMIVDLVRNDLSRIATRGSVRVNELAALYTFPKVHQLISSISCQVDSSHNFTDIISKTFPMGSMTGAPKIRAMQLVEDYELTKRGVFSGATGFIDPSGDFDFNVMIRSFLYRQEKNYLSVMAGSAITACSDPEKEYRECLLKAGYVISAIGGRID